MLSANSGHLDLIRAGCSGIVPISSNYSLKLPMSDGENLSIYGESDPDDLFKNLCLIS